MPDSVNNTKTRILDENDLTPLTNDDILDILDGDGSTNLPDDMPDD